MPRGYKKTEVGVIPEDWGIGPLRTCLRRPPSYGINAAAVPFDDLLPTYLRITDIDDEGRFTPSPRVAVRHLQAGQYFLEAGDLVFARTGASVGKSYLYDPDDGPLVYAGFLIRVSPDPNRLVPAFLKYYVQSERYWDWVSTMSIRSGQPGINGQEYGSLVLPIPDPAEQRAIAKALSDVDALIAALDNLIAKKRAIKTAAMQPLLTGRQRLPGFSGEWEVKRLGDVFQFLSTANNPRSDLSEYGEVGYIHYGDIHGSTSEFLDCATGNLPGIPGFKVKDIPHLEEGDLVMADASEDYEGIGKSIEIRNVNGRKVVAGLHTFLLRGNKELLADGFKGYIQHNPGVRAALVRLATGISVYGVSKNSVKSIEIALPRIAEQTAIATVLADMDAEVAALEARRDKTKAIKQGMMQELLTGRTRLP